MTKIVVKKNVKPQKKIKQKQKQTQKQNVTVNIGTNIIKKRGRPKKAQPTKQVPTKQAQPIISPSFSSFNQPIFKPPIAIPQQSSLASTILATQEKPKVVAEERKEQSSLIKALVEQNASTEIPETKTNDLERVRTKRLEKFEVKPSEAVVHINKVMKTEEPIRHALLGQLIAEPQVDTEEIALLSPQPKIKNIPFNTIDTSSQTDLLSTPLSRLPPITTASNSLSLSSSEPMPSIYALRRYQQKKKLEASLITKQFDKLIQDAQAHEPPSPVAMLEEEISPEVAAQQEEVLKQIQGRGAAEMVSETPSEPTPLTQPSVEMGFGGLSEEPIQTSVGQFLPPEPVSQNKLTVKESKKKGKTILKPIEPPPPITAQQEPEPTILTAQPYVTEQLVKNEPPSGVPLAAAEIIEPSSSVPSELKQIEAKWQELKDKGIITSARTAGGTRRPKEDLLSEIQFVSGYDTWVPIIPSSKPGPKKKPVVAQAVLGGTEL